jgi:hypothetical protein
MGRRVIEMVFFDGVTMRANDLQKEGRYTGLLWF